MHMCFRYPYVRTYWCRDDEIHRRLDAWRDWNKINTGMICVVVRSSVSYYDTHAVRCSKTPADPSDTENTKRYQK
jgi:hypothetical protein